jgi:hypothetical protein
MSPIMPSASAPIRLAVTLFAAVLTLAGCSRVGIAYNTADLLVKGYAKDYLNLEGAQLSGWDSVLDAELARHRAEELPYLAAFFDQLLKASRLGFDERNMTCLTGEFRSLYRRQARFAVTVTAPLLAELSPSQIERLSRRFQDEAAEDRAELAMRNRTKERERRARRYVSSVEDWTGPLDAEQRAIVADVTSRMPDTQSDVVEYRGRKRGQLIGLLRANAGEARIKSFLTEWLVDFKDLPATLDRDGEVLGERIAELFIRLGPTLDERQRERLDNRLRNLRDDFMRLQKQPRMAPRTCGTPTGLHAVA